MAEHAQDASIRPAQPLDTLHRRRLACAIGTDQAHDLTSGDGETHTVHHSPFPVRLAQTSHGHHITFTHVLDTSCARPRAHRRMDRTISLTEGGERPLAGAARPSLTVSRCLFSAGPARKANRYRTRQPLDVPARLK